MQEHIKKPYVTKKINEVHILINITDMIYWCSRTKFHLRLNLLGKKKKIKFVLQPDSETSEEINLSSVFPKHHKDNSK